MTDFVFITASDIHVSDNGPRSRTDNFKETVLGKIGQIRMAANKLNADAVLIAGDLYNLKNPAKNSHALNRELIEAFKQIKAPIYMIEGNHDLTADRLDSLTEQPLGVLFADGTLNQLRNKVIEKNGVMISLVGIPYQDKIDLSMIEMPGKIKTTRFPEGQTCAAQICLMHIYAAPTPGMLFKNRIYGYKELSTLGADVYILGHYHIDQGIVEIDGKHFVNLGSITRGTLADDDVNHKPQMGFIRVSVDDDGKVSYSIKSINLKVRPVEEVFDLKKRDEERLFATETEAFVNRLVTDSTAVKQNYETVLKTMDMAAAVRAKVNHFLQEAKSK